MGTVRGNCGFQRCSAVAVEVAVERAPHGPNKVRRNKGQHSLRLERRISPRDPISFLRRARLAAHCGTMRHLRLSLSHFALESVRGSSCIEAPNLDTSERMDAGGLTRRRLSPVFSRLPGRLDTGVPIRIRKGRRTQLTGTSPPSKELRSSNCDNRSSSCLTTYKICREYLQRTSSGISNAASISTESLSFLSKAGVV